MSPKIFVVGAGSIGTLISTSLESAIPKLADVALILKSRERLQDYIHHDSTLRLWSNVGSQTMLETHIPGHSQYPKQKYSDKPQTIDHLIVTTKATQTENAISALLPSISSSTNILLLQNGIGTYEKLCEKFWPNRLSRPSFLLGIASHGVRPADIPWTYKHVGIGSIKLAVVPTDYDPLYSHHFRNEYDLDDDHHYDSSTQRRKLLSSQYQTQSNPPGTKIVSENRGEGVTPSVSAISENHTSSEEDVKADYSDFDINLQNARKGTPTDSEAAVKSEYSDLNITLQKARKGAPTDSEESVKAEYSNFDINLQKARKGTPTESEESVRAEYSEHKISAKPSPQPNVDVSSDPTDSEASVKADYSDPLHHRETIPEHLPLIFKALLSTKSLLNAQVVPFSEFRIAQFEKLIVNACVNPLTVILRCTNGKLLEMASSEKVLYDIVKECCSVLKAHAHATFSDSELVLLNTQLNPHRMVGVVQDLCKSTANNKSSMLQDVERGNWTELPYINDYIVHLGKIYKRRTDRNALLAQLVRIQLVISRQAENSYVPLSLEL